MAERVPFVGLTLSESHSAKLEMILTNFVLTQMQTEGSTFYRADAAAGPAAGTKRKAETETEGSQGQERPKAKAKGKGKAKSANNKPNENEEENQNEEEETAAPGTASPLPW